MRKALIIKKPDGPCFDGHAFLQQGGMQADAHHDGHSALEAYRSGRYRYVFVSMELQQEDPLAIVREIRGMESELGLPPAQIVLSAPERQPSETEIQRYQICGVIRSHRMR